MTARHTTERKPVRTGRRPARSDRPTATLSVRLRPTAGTESQKQRVVERLRSLVERGALAEYTVLGWPATIRTDGPLEEVPYCRHLLDHVAELREWVEESGVDCREFAAREVTSTLAREAYDVVCLPAICLAVYDEAGELVDVYPRHDGDATESVSDGLDALASSSRVVGRPSRG